MLPDCSFNYRISKVRAKELFDDTMAEIQDRMTDRMTE